MLRNAVIAVVVFAFGLGSSCMQEGPMPDQPQPSITSSAVVGNPLPAEPPKPAKSPALEGAEPFTPTPGVSSSPESPCDPGTVEIFNPVAQELRCVSATEGCMSVGGGIAPQPVFTLLDLGSEGTTLPESVEALCFRIESAPPCAALAGDKGGLVFTQLNFEVMGNFTASPPILRVLTSPYSMSEGKEVGWGVGQEVLSDGYHYLYRIPVELFVPEGETPLVIIQADMSAAAAGDALKVSFAGYAIELPGSGRFTHDQHQFFSGPSITVVPQ